MKPTIQLGLALSLMTVVCSLEVPVPERFLRPRNFNPHPYSSTVDDPQTAQFLDILASQDLSDLPHPYRFFERPPTRGEPSSGSPIQFPKVPEEAAVQPPQPTARLKPANIKHPLNVNNGAHLNQIPLERIQVQRVRAEVPVYYPVPSPVPQRVEPSPEVRLGTSHGSLLTLRRPVHKTHHVPTPKNYAFSYAVRDGHTGDDFSHSQAHSGAQTKGEYRVKLPDGRIQVVSYTADDSGYKADVRYDHENSVEPVYSAPIKYKPLYKPAYKPQYKPDYKLYRLHYSPKPDYTPIHEEPAAEEPSRSTHVLHHGANAQFYIATTPSPTSDYETKFYSVSSTPSPLYDSYSPTTPSYESHSQNYYLVH